MAHVFIIGAAMNPLSAGVYYFAASSIRNKLRKFKWKNQKCEKIPCITFNELIKFNR